MLKHSARLPTIKRLPQYLTYVQSITANFISATTIAKALELNEVVVRKDLAAISSSGKPKKGYERTVLIKELQEFLGYNDFDNAVIVGAGKLGTALLSYEGFEYYGLNILAAFDENPPPEGETATKPVFHISKLENLCHRLHVLIGIITVPADQAQTVCDQLISAGIVAIWNFAPVHLQVPQHIIVQNENLSASLAVLSGKLKQKW